MDGMGKSDYKIKDFDGIELMQMQGFDLSYFTEGNVPESQAATSIVGNMFNAFMFQAFMIATTTGVGGNIKAVQEIDVKDADDAAVSVDESYSYEISSEDER